MPTKTESAGHPIIVFAALVGSVYGLHLAGPYIEPFLIAGFLAILGQGPTRWLTERGLPRGVAVTLVVVAMLGVMLGLGVLVATSLSSFEGQAPLYRRRVEGLLADVVVEARAVGLSITTADISPWQRSEQLTSRVLDYAGTTVALLSDTVSNVFLTLFTMVLLMLKAGSIAGKLRSLRSDPTANLAAFRQIGAEMKNYIWIKTWLSLITGVVVTLWLLMLDVDLAVLWGLVAFALNFIPNIGSIVAAIPACLLALVQHGPLTALIAIAGYAAVNTVVGNVVEPVWLGRRLGLSTLVVFLSLVVWGAMWGPIGMLLSVPLTMAIKILCEHSARYQFVATLLAAEADEGINTWRTLAPNTLSRYLAKWRPAEPPPSTEAPSEDDDADRARAIEEASARVGTTTEVSRQSTDAVAKAIEDARGAKDT